MQGLQEAMAASKAEQERMQADLGAYQARNDKLHRANEELRRGWRDVDDGDQAQEDMEANQQDQEEVEAQMEDAHGGQSPPQRLTRSMFKALGGWGHLFSLFVISLVEGA